MKKLLSLLTINLFITASVSAANFYFTRGTEGENATRNWSDALNWSTGSWEYNTNGWNTSGNSTLVPGVGDEVNFNCKSAYNGNDTNSFALNLDVDVTIKKLKQSDASDIITKITSAEGKAITFSNTSGGVVIEKLRCLQTMTFDTDVILSTTADKTQTISMTSDKDLIFNKNIVYKQESGAPAQYGRSMGFEIKYRTASQWTKKESGNIVINGSLCTYDSEGKEANLPKQITLKPNKKISAATSDEVVGKFVFQGAGYTRAGFALENGAVVDFARDNAGAACISGTAIEMYDSSTINFVKDDQLSSGVSIQFKRPDIDGYGGTLNMMGNSVKNISYLYFSGYVNNTSKGKVDFGANTLSQEFSFGGMNHGSGTGDLIYGVDFYNFDIDNDIIVLTKYDEAALTEAIEHIFFADMGERGVDYNVIFTDLGNAYSISYELIPEPSSIAAAFGAMAIAFVIYRRRK